MILKKMCGGGVNVLKSRKNDGYQSPFEIELLFDNKKLEIFQYLVILYSCLKDTGKKKLSLEQLLYYYTIIFFVNDGTKTPLIFKYSKDKSKLNGIIIALSSLGFIEVAGNLTSSINTLKISITEEGIRFIEEAKSESINKYMMHMRDIIIRNPYEKKLLRFNKLLYEGEYSYEDQ